MDGWIIDGWGDPSLRTDSLLRGIHEAEAQGGHSLQLKGISGCCGG
jgi:hypothetical protein